ncbi:hypothetical protein ACNKHN_08510 [Shigella flexneri]
MATTNSGVGGTFIFFLFSPALVRFWLWRRTSVACLALRAMFQWWERLPSLFAFCRSPVRLAALMANDFSAFFARLGAALVVPESCLGLLGGCKQLDRIIEHMVSWLGRLPLACPRRLPIFHDRRRRRRLISRLLTFCWRGCLKSWTSATSP